MPRKKATKAKKAEIDDDLEPEPDDDELDDDDDGDWDDEDDDDLEPEEDEDDADEDEPEPPPKKKKGGKPATKAKSGGKDKKGGKGGKGGLDRTKLTQEQQERVEAFQQSRARAKQGWTPPADPENPYICELTKVDVRSDPQGLSILECTFKIMDDDHEDNGKPLHEREFRQSFWERNGDPYVWTLNGLYGHDKYPLDPQEAAEGVTELIGNQYQVTVIQPMRDGEPITNKAGLPVKNIRIRPFSEDGLEDEDEDDDD